jgi:hypothetical protein
VILTPYIFVFIPVLITLKTITRLAETRRWLICSKITLIYLSAFFWPFKNCTPDVSVSKGNRAEGYWKIIFGMSVIFIEIECIRNIITVNWKHVFKKSLIRSQPCLYFF